MPNFQRRQHLRTRFLEFILCEGFLSAPSRPRCIWALGPRALLTDGIETRERREFFPLSSGMSQLSFRLSGCPNRLGTKDNHSLQVFPERKCQFGVSASNCGTLKEVFPSNILVRSCFCLLDVTGRPAHLLAITSILPHPSYPVLCPQCSGWSKHEDGSVSYLGVALVGQLVSKCLSGI